MLARPARRASPTPDDTWELHVDSQEADRRKRERVIRLNTVTVPKLRIVGFALVSLSVFLHNYFAFGTADLAPWMRLNLVLGAYCAASWYLLHLFYADLQKYFDLGLLFLVLDLAMDGLAIHASGGERSWLFFLAVFRVVDQTPISQRRALFFAHLAPFSYLGVVLYIIAIEGRAIPLGPELAKLTVIYAGSLYTAMVARNADRRTHRMAHVIRLARQAVAELGQKSQALEASSTELRQSLDSQSRLADENATLYAAAQRDRTRQQQIFDSTSDGIIFVTPDGQIEAANVRAGDLLDFDPQSVIGVELARLVSRLYTVSGGDSFLPTLQDLLERPWAGGHGDLQQPSTGRILHWIAQPARDLGGDVLGLTFTFQDVTRARGLVLELDEKSRLLEEARAQAEDANRAKGVFLANVSHEIRTPLSAIIGIARHLEDNSAPDAMVRRIRTSAESLMAIIDDILDLSKIESRTLALERVPFALRAAVQDAVETLRVQADEKSLGLHVEIDDAAPDALVGDPLRLRQVLVNLLGNGIKFTERGEVRLKVGVAAAMPDEVVLHFRVMDTGIGIPRDKQDLVFQPFAQGDGSAGRKHGGTGLGLSISMRLVNMMRGDLWVDSEAGQGATFSFTATFGVAADAAGPADDDRPASAAMTPRVILVAEDDNIHRRLLTAMLSARGHRVLATKDGREALGLLARERVDAALFDLQMPGLDGLRATESIRAWERSAGGHLPVLGMTASVLGNEDERSRHCGMDHLVLKPMSRDTLFGWIDSLPESRGHSLVPPELAGHADFLASLGDDLPRARALVGSSLEEGGGMLTQLQAALRDEDRAGAIRALQGLSGTLQRLPPGESLHLVQQMANSASAGDLVAVRDVLPRLSAEIARLRDVLPALVRDRGQTQV
jgi:signal transduction histidine kinase/CheY-like chemotaxis protein